MKIDQVMKLENIDQSVKYFLKNEELQQSNTEVSLSAPLISVIITTFNRSDLLDRAIKSVQIQTYGNIEIIIIDDQSTDSSTRDVLNEWENKSRYPLTFYINEKNSGPSVSRKNGIDKANGEYLVFMDDDDYYININAFTVAIDHFRKYSKLSFVSGDSLLEYSDTRSIEYKPLNVHGYMDKNNYLSEFQVSLDKPRSTFSTVFSRVGLEKSEAFEMGMFNDSSIYLRALLVGDAYIVNDIWGIYYVHDNNISKSIDCEFIVENMKEKYKVYTIMLNDGFEEKNWIVNQFDLTIRYFFTGNNTKKLNILVKWINSIEDNKIRQRLKYSFYKELAKNKLKNLKNILQSN